MDEKFVICPFNKHHVISRLRIQYHIVKCKKNYPSSKKIICPYDATEYIDPINFTAHLSQCKRKRHLDVTEEFRNKQFELVQHGDMSSQSFLAPGVEVTDEWNIKSHEQDDEENLTQDELNAMKLKYSMSRAVQNACKFSPVVTQPVGRGKGIDHYQYYMNGVQESPGNSSVSKSVTYFPNLMLTQDVDDGIYDDAEDDDGQTSVYTEQVTPKQVIVDNCNTDLKAPTNRTSSPSLDKLEDDEIYEDAEEETLNVIQSTNLNLEKKRVVDCQGNNSQNVNDVLKYYQSFLGRGANKNIPSRGGALTKDLKALKTENNSGLKTLDSIIAKVIMNDMLENAEQPSKCDKKLTTPPEKCNRVVNCSSNSVHVKSNENKTPKDLLPSNTSNKALSKSHVMPFELSDEMICFRKSPKPNNSRTSLDSLLNNIVNDLALTALDNVELAKSSGSESSDENEDVNLKANNNRLTQGFGRGEIWKDQF